MASKDQKLKVAIVHDWLIGGGAEKVVLELHNMYPDAPIYTSYCTDEWRKKLDNKVVTGFLQKGPFPKLRKFIPFLRIWWFSQLDLTEYDLIISSTGAEAKGIKDIREDAVHICYCHAPTHYYWSRYESYLENPGFGALNWLARIGLRLLVYPLRQWDYLAAQRPHYMIANSTHTQNMIKQYYERNAVVVHPPVDTAKFGKWQKKNDKSTERHGFIAIGRQTPYKRIDLAVAACTELNLPLTVIGNGPEHQKLVDMAGPSITFVTNASDEELAKSLASAETFIFPGLDDFGIAPVEAMAAGTPVIAYDGGGALDYVSTGSTGLLFAEQTVESLVQALKLFNPEDYSAEDIKIHAQKFSIENFHENMQSEINSCLMR